MTKAEKTKRYLTEDLLSTYDSAEELEELIIKLSEQPTATTYLLKGLKSEYQSVLELLAKLKPYDIKTIEQAMIFHFSYNNSGEDEN